MSSRQEPDHVRSLAARIALRLAEASDGGGGDNSRHAPAEAANEGVGRELAALREGVTEISQRLAHLESHVIGAGECEHESAAYQYGRAAVERRPPTIAAVGVPPEGTNVRVRLKSSTYVPVNPPSEDRFEINEAVSELADYFERGKVCTMEPGEKPCDHCSMCSSRGF